MRTPKYRWLLCLVALGCAALPIAGRTAEAFSPEEYRFIPLRVHLLRASGSPELNGRLQESDVRRILGKVNEIWKQAGVQFWSESVLTEQAAAQELYATLGENRTVAHLRLVRPRKSLSDQLFQLYVVRDMAPNGICLDSSYQTIFVKETASLQKVKGGTDEPLARVAAHELGHALNLEHRQDTYNLMASGTTGTSLNAAEIQTARKAAEGYKFNLKPDAALSLALRTEPENHKSAQGLYMALAALPEGKVAEEARQHLMSDRG